MDEKLNKLLLNIKQLEQECLVDLRGRAKEFGDEIRGRKVRFSKAISRERRKVATSLLRYLWNAKFLSIVTALIIWSCVVPLLLLHPIAVFFQFVCFPIYGIPKVRIQDCFITDRIRLLYVNPLERINCLYCGYANGLLAYVQEIAGRTEQFWCPIKHAMHLRSRHSRYQRFFNYGDAEQFREKIEEVRREFDDLKKSSAAEAQNSKIKRSNPVKLVPTHHA